jgi:hypothetical protein
MRMMRRLATWRQDPEDRLAQDSFLDDVAAHWKPATPAERALELRSRAWHLVARLFDGRGTLAPVALSLVPSAIATAILAVADAPQRADYGESPPALGYVLLTIGAIGLACEAFISPHTIRPGPWSLFSGPIAAGSAMGAIGTGKNLAPDLIVVVGFVLLAAGMFVLTALPAVRAVDVQARWLRIGMVVSGLGLLATVVGDLYWTALFRADGDYLWALATGLASVGAWLFGTTLIRSRPALAMPAAA